MNFLNANRLTSREIEVLKMLSQEFSTKEIAKNLNLSSSTIETHRRNLMNKMQVKNVAGLIRKSFELGILRVDRKNQFQSSGYQVIGSIGRPNIE